MALASDVARVRAFNRFYTARIGVLMERPYDGFSLAEVRVLFELAHAESLQPAAIARELGLDPAYLSRILARFRRLKLIERRTDPDDRRSVRVKLTAKGRATFAPLDAASNEKVADLLKPLSAQARRDLVAAAGSVQTLLDAEQRAPEIRLRDLAVGDIGWIAHRHGVLYLQEYGWDIGFEALVAEILSKFVNDFDPAREKSWIAERNGEIVGSVFLQKSDDPSVAKLRLLYVEPSARGHGLGATLVQDCIEGARGLGYRRLELWTNDVLVAARRIYERAGFKLIAEEPRLAFGKDQVFQTWRLEL